jgi:hypothetical protein
MSKSSIQNVTTTQTFQNWLDKTNEMVDIFRDSAVTASVSGDTTVGDATILGEFTANTVAAADDLRVNLVTAYTAGQIINFDHPVNITGTTSEIVATFTFGASGAKTRYTDGTTAWEIGIDNSTDANFLIQENNSAQFKLSRAGVLTVPSLTVTEEITFPRDADGNITGTIESANGNFTDTLTANTINATTINSDDIRGKFYGDIYHPAAGGGNGSGKVFENGGPDAAIPATMWGNVQGTVSSITNHNTNFLDEGTDNRVGESVPGARDGGNNRYFTEARARASFSAGTGVGITSGGQISIGQTVGTTSNVTFNNIDAAGRIICEGDVTAFGTISDMTMKENILPIENALDKVSQLGGYLFNYKNNPTPMTGVMAQELVDVLPEAVYKTRDPNTNEEIYAVRHGNVIGLLIEAIKELSAKVGK